MIQCKQFYGYKIETDAKNLPLTLDEVETHLRITPDSEDTYLTLLIDVVSDFFERYTNRTLINKSYKAYLDDFPFSTIDNYDSNYCAQYEYTDGMLIRKAKVSSITSIKYYTDSVLTTWDSANYYLLDAQSYPSVCLVDGSEYPDVDNRKQAIEIIFVAGYGADSTYIPSDIKMALLNHIAFLYENRGDCDPYESSCRLPCASKTIYDSYRIPRVGW